MVKLCLCVLGVSGSPHTDFLAFALQFSLQFCIIDPIWEIDTTQTFDLFLIKKCLWNKFFLSNIF